MIENEDKLPNNNLKDNEYWKSSYPWKYLLNTIINFKKLLEALLLEYMSFTQYEIHFWKSNKWGTSKFF